MRNKVFLIKGIYQISEEITFAEFERINADHVVVISALRRPQFLPDDFDLSLSKIEFRVGEILDHWRHIDQEHIVASEYAQVALDHGMDGIRCIEGVSLRVDWFYETIRTIHRQAGHTVVDVETFYKNKEPMVRIGETTHSRDEAIERLKPEGWLG